MLISGEKVDGIIRIHTDFDNNGIHYPEVEKITRNDLTMHDLSVPVTKYDVDNRVEYIKRFDVTVWQHNNFGLLIDGTVNPVSETELQLNGQPVKARGLVTGMILLFLSCITLSHPGMVLMLSHLPLTLRNINHHVLAISQELTLLNSICGSITLPIASSLMSLLIMITRC